MCRVKDANLSYESLTSRKTRGELHALKSENPAFHAELTGMQHDGIVFSSTQVFAEDEVADEPAGDDSDIPLSVLVMGKKLSRNGQKREKMVPWCTESRVVIVQQGGGRRHEPCKAVLGGPSHVGAVPTVSFRNYLSYGPNGSKKEMAPTASVGLQEFWGRDGMTLPSVCV